MTTLNFCKDCGRYGTWRHIPEKDFPLDSHIMETYYKCSCGASTIMPERRK